MNGKIDMVKLAESVCGFKTVETLKIQLRIDGMVMLKDYAGFCLGTFKTVAEANTWAHENGYKTRQVN